MKRYFASVFFLLGMAAFSPLWAQENDLPNGYQLKLDANGNVPPEFWSYEIPFNPVTETITVIDIHVNLLNQSSIDLDKKSDDPNSPQAKKDQKLVEDIIQALAQGGVTLGEEERFGTNPEQNVSAFAVKPIDKSNLYLWRIGSLSFLVNPLKPSQVVQLSFDNDNDSDESLYSAKALMLSPDVYRVFCDLSSSCNGCGAGTCQWLSVFDVDFKNVKWVRWDFPKISSYSDLNQDGNTEIVIAAGIDDMVFFPWVYTWDGTKWIDQRAQFWKCYQNGKLGPEADCAAGNMSKVPEALSKAIAADEPLKYWKNDLKAQSGVAGKGTVSDYLSSAKKSLAAKDYPSAIADYRKALGVESSNSKIYVYLGYAYILGGQREQAQDALNHAIAWDTESPLAHYNLALCDWVFRDQEKEQGVADAASEMVKALDLDPALKSLARQTIKLNGLLKTPEFQSALFRRNYQVPYEFLKTFPNVPLQDWAGQTFMFLRNPNNILGVWEDDAFQKQVTSAVTLQGQTFEILGPIGIFDPQQPNKPQVLHIKMSDNGHRYLLHTYDGENCAQIAPCGDYEKAKERWIGHDLWMVSPKPVTLAKGTVLSTMQKVTVEDVQWGDWFAHPIRLILRTSEGVTDSMDVGVDFSNFSEFNLAQSGRGDRYWNDFFDRVKSGKDGGNYFCNLFTEQDPVLMVKKYLSQTNIKPKD